MARKLHRGAFRTALEYVLIVMGGTALFITLRIALGGNWYFDSHGYIHPGFRASLVSGSVFFLRILGSLLVLAWLLLGALLYLCALGLIKLFGNGIFPRLALALVSMIVSGGIVILLPPAVWPSLPALYFMMLIAGLLGGLFGFFLPSRSHTEAFQTAPLGRGHWALISAWTLYLVVAYGHWAYSVHKVHSLNDPSVDLLFVKWAPAEGEIREVPMGKFDDTFPRLRESEIEELRAAGFTGTLRFCGNHHFFGSPSSSRVVIVMSRGVHETINLPKPATGAVLYLQTEEGWKAFPPATPTVPRTLRLTYSEPNAHQTEPSTDLTADMGLGHPRGGLGFGAFHWLPEEFQAPLPSLAAAKPVSQ